MRIIRARSLLLSLPISFLLAGCSPRNVSTPPPEQYRENATGGYSSLNLDSEDTTCASLNVFATAKRRVNQARRETAERITAAAYAAHNEDLAARSEALMIVRAQQIPDRSNPASLEHWKRVQWLASASSVNYLRAAESASLEQLETWVATVSADDWRDYAEYAEIRAAAFAFADSASTATSADERQRYQTLHAQAVEQASTVEARTQEVGWMYAVDLLAELERGRCVR